MKKRLKIPFQEMKPAAWLNLALAALAALYLVQTGMDIHWQNTFGNLGIDFGSFWSAGYIANHYGYAKVYDLQLMQQVQQALQPSTANNIIPHPIPTPYLSIFLLPFQLLALLPPVAAFCGWTALNLTAFLLYARFFIASTTRQRASNHLLALTLISAPVFLNFFDGQANVWLAICVGEYLRAAMEERSLRAGLWLGGLFLKPQCLIILGPALLVQRSWKALAGLAVSGAAAVLGSMSLGGIDALSGVIRLWLGYAGGLPSNDVQLMMNWRMIGLQVGRISTETAGLDFAVVGAIGTFVASMYLWRRAVRANPQTFAIALLGSMAATGAVAWHSHVHMAMILIMPLIYLYVAQTEMFKHKLETWVFVSGGHYALRIILASGIYAGILPAPALNVIDSLTGMGMFGLNLYLLGWAVGRLRIPLAEPGVAPE